MTGDSPATPTVPIPDVDRGTVVIPAPGAGPGHWAGAPSAIAHGDHVYLTYRLRRPVGDGRGYRIVVARSTDGERFETIYELDKDSVGAESLERPALAVTAEGTWHLYVSGATPGTLHWWVDVIEAPDPAAFDPSTRVSMLPGDPATAFKDPVVVRDGDQWHLWVCVHSISDPTRADAMVARYASSSDGLHWSAPTSALAPRPGTWDERGTRVASVLVEPDRFVAYYDGRATFEQNWEEQTGLAYGTDPGSLEPAAVGPVAVSPYHGGGLRYVSAVRTSDGGIRLYYELTGPDGSHDLRTEYAPPVR